MNQEKTIRPEGLAREFYESAEKREALLDLHPGFHNLIGFEKAWKEIPEYQDFLRPSSPLYYTKQISTRLYLSFFEPWLARLGPDTKVLDAGCGIGRFAIPLARRFASLTAFDPCRESIQACSHYLKQESFSNVELHWTDLSWIENLEPDSFDLVFAAELICYLASPKQALESLIRIVRPGGAICFSVEGRPGALTAQDVPEIGMIGKALAGEPLLIFDDRYVRFFTKGELEKMASDLSLQDVEVRGSHYYIEGPFWQAIDDSKLKRPAYAEKIFKAEREAANNQQSAPMARVFLVAGTVA